MAFVAHKFPPLVLKPNQNTTKFFIALPPTVHEPNLAEAAYLPVPPLKIVQVLCDLASASDANLYSITIPHLSQTQANHCYPMQLAFYWNKIIAQHEIQQSWSRAVKAVEDKLCGLTSSAIPKLVNATFH